MKRSLSYSAISSLAVAAAFLLSGCASMSKTQEGAAVGGAAGAVLGGIIGNQTGSTARGAILGAAIGGAAGAVIGRRMDEQAEALEEELPGAEVERVGEGIQVTFDSGILFDFDSYALRPEAREHLTNLAASLNEYPDSEVLIVGHTDSSGADEYNQRLSENRANAAGNHVIRAGVTPSRVKMMGLGETEPVASNDTEDGMQLNRRVEVAIFASEEYRKKVGGGGDF
ncbi:MAG: OmpA family protein [Gemmatimonadota bacterium]|jgi:outer membrane protein OmpA-like peptidoglycan-associated protein